MNFLKKIFCGHQWISHNKTSRTESYRIPNTMEYVKTRDYTKEVSICKICGKIKQIEY